RRARARSRPPVAAKEPVRRRPSPAHAPARSRLRADRARPPTGPRTAPPLYRVPAGGARAPGAPPTSPPRQSRPSPRSRAAGSPARALLLLPLDDATLLRRAGFRDRLFGDG